MEILAREDVEKLRDKDKRNAATNLEWYIFELNSQLAKTQDSSFVGKQVVLNQADFSDLVQQLQDAGYSPEWEEAGWREENGEGVFNLRIPLTDDDGTYCSNCNAKFKPLHFLHGDGVQFDGSLPIGFFGGFGMYLESRAPGAPKPQISGATAEVLFCSECADKLCEAFPSIARAIHSAPQF